MEDRPPGSYKVGRDKERTLRPDFTDQAMAARAGKKQVIPEGAQSPGTPVEGMDRKPGSYTQDGVPYEAPGEIGGEAAQGMDRQPGSFRYDMRTAMMVPDAKDEAMIARMSPGEKEIVEASDALTTA